MCATLLYGALALLFCITDIWKRVRNVRKSYSAGGRWMGGVLMFLHPKSRVLHIESVGANVFWGSLEMAIQMLQVSKGSAGGRRG